MNKILSFVRLDFAALKPYSKSLYMYAMIVIFVGVTNDSLNVVFAMVMVGLPMILSYPFAISEKNSLDTLYSTLSLGRRDVVIGRYVFVFVIEMIAIAALLILAVIKSNFSPLDMTIEETFLYLSVLSMMFSIIISFQYPVFFKFGYTKAKLYTYIPLLLTFLIIGVLPTIMTRLNIKINWQAINQILMKNSMLTVLLPILIGVISLLISCMVSMKIYERKDI
ncbi:ABC-2 transporter permease [Garciella nitratireducens]|jgi:ABC-2 type transport system permease protein|uniref:ABC-2 transporter permease n=1 Tax=Garciella nitratireducens TaxID=218205 RepID=UPI001BD40530|nr:ABC-2 transporter permease [Garciella nitratireducens]